MAKVYRAIQQWNHWLTHVLGRNLLEIEQQGLSSLLSSYYGKQVLMIGVPEQYGLLQSSSIPHRFLLGPLNNRDTGIRYIEGDLDELPIHSGSVDLVVVPHTFELIDNPQRFLAEACRVIKPEGHIFILGFNPFSFWGLKKLLMRHKNTPWSGNFVSTNTIKKWLALADFELENQKMIFFRPPLRHHRIFQKLKWLEWLGSKFFQPLGGVYILQAKAKVIPLTPIRMHWKQELSGVRIAPGMIPGSSIRVHS